MATRRPKVPRADALGRPQQKAADGGAVIRADFGESRKAAAAAAEVAAESQAPASDAAPARRAATAGTAARATGSAKAEKATPAKKPKDPATTGKGTAPAKDTADDPVPAKAFSGRMLALAVVMVAITILLAPTVKIFLEKRAEIAALEAEIAAKEAEQQDLKKQLSRWQDPNYVKQQARDRINMVMPGETGYWVFGADVPAGTPGGRTGNGASGTPGNLPWVDGLWESIRRSATD
ncbi:septation ring formation regulator EzrA [Arthrobacter sp. SW1]|uniref:FtsB family cell division protein n=1 Tax=Arthrobacter sp. SW1 TaxID=1920889 RepID=UPI000877E2E1|nr:septum formation initiator family protein [Arthrobacter sp. SW1]OFI37744.1 septation ring formation regulator EzrA [Arthrobacter sp. SW1]